MKLVKEKTEGQTYFQDTSYDIQFWFSQREGKNKSVKKEGGV